MDLCSLCLTNLNTISTICQDVSLNNIHYSLKCHHTNLYQTSCNHKFHKCCIYSYLWHQTGADCPNEEGIINCPNCRKQLIIKIED